MAGTSSEDLNLVLFAGNKRSGTTMATWMINTHNDIYISLELDTIWYHYNQQSSAPHPMNYHSAHMLDDGTTVSRRSGIARKEPGIFRPDEQITGNVRQDVFSDILWAKDYGVYGRQDPYPEKRELKWVGDKMPAQCCDPQIQPWVVEHFPEVRYIHMVRHPQQSIASMVGLGWGDAEAVTEHWITLEKWAWQVPNSLFLRYEDVCAKPDQAMTQIAEHLGLDPDNRIKEYNAGGRLRVKRGAVMDSNYAKATRRGNPLEIPITDELKSFMKLYGYEEISK